MEVRELRSFARDVAGGRVAPDELVRRVHAGATTDLGYACVDMQRGLRTGVSEVIYGAGKTAGQIAGIVGAMREGGQERVLITRLDEAKARTSPTWVARSSMLRPPAVAWWADCLEPDGNGEVLVLTAGTSDLPVAEEAAFTARFLGNRVNVVHDVGVAGIHRLLSHAEEISRAQVIIAVAGMEGALPSVVGGLARCPVIAVPTSVGYGANPRGCDRAARHVEQLRERRIRREHRQRVWSRVPSFAHQSSAW
ncbi:MAG: nickel pincer cofactor biosynthesis protein LarB [Collinsella sp.]